MVHQDDGSSFFKAGVFVTESMADPQTPQRKQAHTGAKFDVSGYCLNHPMIQLCKPENEVPPVRYSVVRKICPKCGMHDLVKNRNGHTADLGQMHNKARPSLSSAASNVDEILLAASFPKPPFKTNRVSTARAFHTADLLPPNSSLLRVTDSVIPYPIKAENGSDFMLPLTRRHSSDFLTRNHRGISRRNSCGDGSKIYNDERSKNQGVGVPMKTISIRRPRIESGNTPVKNAEDEGTKITTPKKARKSGKEKDNVDAVAKPSPSEGGFKKKDENSTQEE